MKMPQSMKMAAVAATMFLATAMGIIAYSGTLGAVFQAFSSFVALGVAFVTAPAIAAECQPFGQGPGNAGIPGTCANLRGNLGRNMVIGPGLSKLDLSVFKNNYIRRISESFNAQFRAEIFNIFNRANFSSPTDNLAVFDQNGLPIQSGGLIDSTQTTSRQIQFALKLIW